MQSSEGIPTGGRSGAVLPPRRATRSEPARVAYGWPATRGSWATAAVVLAYGGAGAFGCRRKVAEIGEAGRRRAGSGYGRLPAPVAAVGREPRTTLVREWRVLPLNGCRETSIRE
jgi:hypothetical protein